MKNRWPYIIFTIISLVLLILGSFFDLDIAKTIFIKDNFFGTALELMGAFIGYAGICLLATMLFINVLKTKYKKFWKVVWLTFAIICCGVGIYFFGHDVFSTSALGLKDLPFVGYLISALVMAGVVYLGTLLANKVEDREKAIKIFITALFITALALLIVHGTKLFVSRMRYRYMVENNSLSEYTEWWEVFKHLHLSLENDISNSFPSAHTTGACIAAIQFSLLSTTISKTKKYTSLICIIALSWSIIVAYSRLSVGAHFLSDVSFSLLSTSLCSLLGNEILLRFLLKDKKEVKTI